MEVITNSVLALCGLCVICPLLVFRSLLAYREEGKTLTRIFTCVLLLATSAANSVLGYLIYMEQLSDSLPLMYVLIFGTVISTIGALVSLVMLEARKAQFQLFFLNIVWALVVLYIAWVVYGLEHMTLLKM